MNVRASIISAGITLALFAPTFTGAGAAASSLTQGTGTAASYATPGVSVAPSNAYAKTVKVGTESDVDPKIIALASAIDTGLRDATRTAMASVKKSGHKVTGHSQKGQSFKATCPSTDKLCSRQLSL